MQTGSVDLLQDCSRLTSFTLGASMSSPKQNRPGSEVALLISSATARPLAPLLSNMYCCKRTSVAMNAVHNTLPVLDYLASSVKLHSRCLSTAVEGQYVPLKQEHASSVDPVDRTRTYLLSYLTTMALNFRAPAVTHRRVAPSHQEIGSLRPSVPCSRSAFFC